jgi:hypothetical protein
MSHFYGHLIQSRHQAFIREAEGNRLGRVIRAGRMSRSRRRRTTP